MVSQHGVLPAERGAVRKPKRHMRIDTTDHSERTGPMLSIAGKMPPLRRTALCAGTAPWPEARGSGPPAIAPSVASFRSECTQIPLVDQQMRPRAWRAVILQPLANPRARKLAVRGDHLDSNLLAVKVRLPNLTGFNSIRSHARLIASGRKKATGRGKNFLHPPPTVQNHGKKGSSQKMAGFNPVIAAYPHELPSIPTKEAGSGAVSEPSG